MANKSKKQLGRPKKQTRYISARTNVDNEGGLTEEDTCFGVIRRGENSEVVMTEEMFEDIQTKFDTLSQRIKYYTHYTKIEYIVACTKCRHTNALVNV